MVTNVVTFHIYSMLWYSIKSRQPSDVSAIWFGGVIADPLSDGNPGSVCCYDIVEYGPEGIICSEPEGIAMWTERSWPGKA